LLRDSSKTEDQKSYAMISFENEMNAKLHRGNTNSELVVRFDKLNI
jgi:hypothetical protein